MSIRLYWLDSRQVDTDKVRHLMSAARLARMERLMDDEDKRRSAAAELCLVLAMAAERKCAPEAVAWHVQPGGKPVLPGGLCFSIAHSRWLVVCAVSEQEVGVDVEMIRKIDPRMRRKILSAGEQNCPDEALLAKWVAKESYLKYTGEGLSRAMTGFCTADGEITDNDGNRLACLQRVMLPGNDCIVYVCSSQPEEVTVRQEAGREALEWAIL